MSLFICISKEDISMLYTVYYVNSFPGQTPPFGTGVVRGKVDIRYVVPRKIRPCIGCPLGHPKYMNYLSGERVKQMTDLNPHADEFFNGVQYG